MDDSAGNHPAVSFCCLQFTKSAAIPYSEINILRHSGGKLDMVMDGLGLALGFGRG
jgi:hypothetical protein